MLVDIQGMGELHVPQGAYHHPNVICLLPWLTIKGRYEEYSKAYTNSASDHLYIPVDNTLVHSIQCRMSGLIHGMHPESILPNLSCDLLHK